MEFYEESEKKEFTSLGKQFKSVQENIIQHLYTIMAINTYTVHNYYSSCTEYQLGYKVGTAE